MKTNLNEITAKINLPIDEAIDFRNLISALFENKWIILTIMFAITMAATLYSYTKQEQYEASVLIQLKGKGKSGLSSLSQQLNLSSSSDADPTATQIALIRSRFVLEPVVKKLGLATSVLPSRTSFLDRFKTETSSKLNITDFEVPAQFHNKKLHLKIKDKTHYQLFDPNDKLLLEGKIGNLVRDHHGLSIRVVQINAENGKIFDVVKQNNMDVIARILANLRIDELGDGLTAGQTGILQLNVKDVEPILAPILANTIAEVAQIEDARLKSIETAKTLQFLNKQLPLAKKELNKAETALTQYRVVTGKLDVRFEMQQLMQRFVTIEKQITEVKMSKADLLQRFTLKHPVMIGLNEKLNQLELQRKTVLQQIKELPASDQIATNLLREVSVKNQIYLALLNKIQELSVAKASTISDIRVLSLATIPESPLPTNRSVLVVASSVLGLIIGCLIVLVRKTFQRFVNDPHWTERHLGLMNLAVIPFSKQQFKTQKAFKAKLSTSLALLAENSPRDLSIESLRSLRTSFQLITNHAANNIISIMGISQGIGKSFLSANLAYLLADAGKRVLLIDGDLRKGHLHDYFQMKQAPGLSEALSGRVAVEDVIHSTTNAALSFLPVGIYPPNPSELLSNSNLKELLDSLTPQFDLIIIDTAPILAVTDGSIIAAQSATNLLILGSNRHQEDEISIAVKRLNHANITIAGTVFNILKPDTVVSGHFHYNYYSEDQSQKVS